jgi:alpha-L-fucosidase
MPAATKHTASGGFYTGRKAYGRPQGCKEKPIFATVTNFFKMKKMMKRILPLWLLLSCCASLAAKDLRELQQDFVDLKFGMFIHFNIPTFTNHDWPDPEADPAIFNPRRLDCSQWAKAARAAKMRYGCLTTKHHSGFCIWDTKTTDYQVMNSPFKRDVTREYVEAFRNEGLRTMFYFSILDTHHRIRPGYIAREHVAMIKAQLTELLTHYGPIDALIIDGWDAPWSRISYEDIPFEEIYRLVKRLQPDCLVMDLNAAKYPAEALFYTDIKSYEQGAGQQIPKENNRLPALSCLPINRNWFWKESFPTSPVKDPAALVRDNLEPFNRAYCNFILNVAPNRDGLIDDNALEALKTIGALWDDTQAPVPLPAFERPIVSENIAKGQPVNSSWSDDMMIMDFGNDDDFRTSWRSNPEVSIPWFEIDFPRYRAFNTIVVYDTRQCIRTYRLLYERNGVWETLLSANNDRTVKVHRFDRVWGGKVKIIIDASSAPPAIAEFGVYDEPRDETFTP